MTKVERNDCCICRQKNAAYEQYESQLQEIQLDEEQAQKKADEEAKLEAELTLHKASLTPTDLSRQYTQHQMCFDIACFGPEYYYCFNCLAL